jgi:hypothetical protein
VSGHLIKPAGVARLRRWKLLDAVLATGCPRSMTGCCGWTASHSTRDADLLAWAVTYSWDGDLDTALAGYGRQRDKCALPLSDANLRVARLDMPTGPLGAAWFQVTKLEQTLDDPAAVSGQPSSAPSAAPRRSIIKGAL